MSDMFDNKDEPATKKEDENVAEKPSRALPRLDPEPESETPKPISKPSIMAVKLSDMESKLLKDIKREFQNVARTRYAHPIDLRIWLIKHDYPEDFIEAACSL